MRSQYQAGKSFDDYPTFEDHLRKMHAQTQATSHLQSDWYRCGISAQVQTQQAEHSDKEREDHICSKCTKLLPQQGDDTSEKNARRRFQTKIRQHFKVRFGSGLGLLWLDGINADEVVTDPAEWCVWFLVFTFLCNGPCAPTGENSTHKNYDYNSEQIASI